MHGAQGLYGVTPDLSTFGKALGNGFAVSRSPAGGSSWNAAGCAAPHERVFLLSTTHGGETHALAAAMAVLDVFTTEERSRPPVAIGEKLARGVGESRRQPVSRSTRGARPSQQHGVRHARPDGKPSQDYRTLFMRQRCRAGVLAPSFVVSSALTDEDIERTVEAVAQACVVYREALDEGDPSDVHRGPVGQAGLPEVRLIGLSPPAGDLDLLCLGAHPDDIEIACGGTLLALSAGRKVRATAVVFTGAGERRAEGLAATPRFVPGCEVQIVGLPDGRLPTHWETVKQTLEDVAASCKPQLILAPRPDDAHQDYRLVAELVTTVWRDALVLHYEIPKWDGDLGRVTHYVPLSDKIARRKVDLLDECFPTQRHHDWWSEETFLALMRLRGVECRHRYAEAFVVGKAVLDV